MELLKPDDNHSILNLITSILKNYQVETKYNGLKTIDQILKKSYKNVVLIILDGMGENILKYNSENGLFKTNQIDTITSVYPSTTAAAMTTYYSGKPPIETGWLAWTQYFKEYGRNINVLPEMDFDTGEQIKVEQLMINDIIGYQTIYQQINEANKKVKTYEIMPDYCVPKAEINEKANTVEKMCEKIITLCQNKEEKFIMAYHDNPDSIIHQYGCYAKETKEYIQEIERQFEKMIQQLKGTDTLLLVSADHGHQDIRETIDLLGLNQIQDCLIMPPTLEGRMIGFFVKRDKEQEFETEFKKVVKDKYILYHKNEFLQSGLLGQGNQHRKIEDFIGDYIAIATADTTIKLGTYLTREKNPTKVKKATHCGLTKNEMEVPLILFDLKIKK